MKMKFYTLGLMLCLAGSSFAQKNRVVAQKGTPTMDGEIDAAYNMNNQITKSITRTEPVENICNGQPPKGNDPNNTTTFGVLWDEKYLYVAAKVVDASVIPGEAIEIFYSLTNSKLSDPNCEKIDFSAISSKKGYTEGDGQYYITQNDLVESNFRTILEQPAGSKKVFTRTTDGYVMEIALSWEEMLVDTDVEITTLQNGHVMGFDIFNQDNDADGANIQASWNQCCANRNYGETVNFGELVIEGTREPDPLATADMKNILSSLSLYPNPANAGKVEVNLTAVTSETVKVSLVNSLSENLYSSDLKLVPGQNVVPVSLSELTNGLYYIMVSNGKSVTSQKLVVAK